MYNYKVQNYFLLLRNSNYSANNFLFIQIYSLILHYTKISKSYGNSRVTKENGDR